MPLAELLDEVMAIGLQPVHGKYQGEMHSCGPLNVVSYLYIQLEGRNGHRNAKSP
jgi:hypothetical protein